MSALSSSTTASSHHRPERNRFAKTLGFEDFYDMKVTQAEGFSKKTCFEMLDGLERATAPLLDAALAKLESEKGADARKPWNLSYALSGELTREMDPYFPFENAPEVWGRSFAAMGITYRDTKMRLDLCDRAGKYPNGFCHWPVAPHKGQDGKWNASEAISPRSPRRTRSAAGTPRSPR